jgi:hypothetical protein
LNQDASAFRDWCAGYSLRCERERHTDEALLPDLVAARVKGKEMRKPDVLALYGFDIMTPQQQAVFDALQAAETEVFVCAQERREASVLRLACVDARDEIERAATWARARLEADPHARIGIVVPDLSQQRKALIRTFRTVMAQPRLAARIRCAGCRAAAACANGGPLPANGGPLLRMTTRCRSTFRSAPRSPAIRWCRRPASSSNWRARNRVRARQPALRSPFIAAESEAAAARGSISSCAGAEPASPQRLLDTIDRAGAARRRWRNACATGRVPQVRSFRRARASAWARAITDALKLMGFPDKGRSLDSPEYQTLKKWHEVVAGFAMLDG